MSPALGKSGSGGTLHYMVQTLTQAASEGCHPLPWRIPSPVCVQNPKCHWVGCLEE